MNIIKFAAANGKQLAQRLPALSPRVGNNIHGQDPAEILLESTGDGVFEGKRHWRCAESSRRNSSQVRILRQGLIVILPGLDGCPWRSCYFGQSNRVVRCWRGWRVVLCKGPYSAEKERTKQEQLISELAPHVRILARESSVFLQRSTNTKACAAKLSGSHTLQLSQKGRGVSIGPKYRSTGFLAGGPRR